MSVYIESVYKCVQTHTMLKCAINQQKNVWDKCTEGTEYYLNIKIAMIVS